MIIYSSTTAGELLAHLETLHPQLAQALQERYEGLQDGSDEFDKLMAAGVSSAKDVTELHDNIDRLETRLASWEEAATTLLQAHTPDQFDEGVKAIRFELEHSP